MVADRRRRRRGAHRARRACWRPPSALPEAIAEHLVLLRLEPLRVASLQALRRLCDRAGERRRAARVAAALAALGLDRRGRRARGPRGTPALDARDDRQRSRAPNSSRSSATPTRATRRPLLLAAMSEVLPRLYGLALEDWGVDKQDRLAAAFGRSAARAGQPGRHAVRRRGHVRRLPGARDRHPGRDRGGPAAGAAAAAELRRAAAARGLPAARAAARTSARRDVRGRAHPGEGSRPPGRRRRANGLLRLRARHPARGAAERRGAEDLAHAAAAAPARVRAGGARSSATRVSSTANGGAPPSRTPGPARRSPRRATCWARSSSSRAPTGDWPPRRCSRPRSCWPPRAPAPPSSI